MKIKDIKALHEMTIAKLGEQVAKTDQSLAQARIKKKAGKLENTSLIKVLADDLARIKTILTAKISQAKESK